MRHKVFGKKLNRDVKERKALFKNLIISLIFYGRIKTSLTKAKAIQHLSEKLVTKVKGGSDAALRQVSSFLTRREAIDKLVSEVAPRFKNKTGGYTRIRRIGQRQDATEEVIMEWSVAEEKKSIAEETKTKEEPKKLPAKEKNKKGPTNIKQKKTKSAKK